MRNRINLNRGGWFATSPILDSGEGFVNPDFSTGPVQGVPTRFLYLRTGTSGIRLSRRKCVITTCRSPRSMLKRSKRVASV